MLNDLVVHFLNPDSGKESFLCFASNLSSGGFTWPDLSAFTGLI